MFLLRELAGYESGFLVKLLITTIWANSHLSLFFFASTSSPANSSWSSRRLQRNNFSSLKTSLEDVLQIHLEDVLKTSSRRLVRCLEGVLKTSSRRICKTSSRCLQDVLKTSWKTKNCYTEDVLKASWRRLGDKQNVYWNISIKP